MLSIEKRKERKEKKGKQLADVGNGDHSQWLLGLSLHLSLREMAFMKGFFPKALWHMKSREITNITDKVVAFPPSLLVAFVSLRMHCELALYHSRGFITAPTQEQMQNHFQQSMQDICS